MRQIQQFTVILAACCAILPQIAPAASVRTLVERGNSAYAGGKYDEALSAFEEAGVSAPESAVIFFNNGTAYYRKGDYDKAIECFQKAAMKTKYIGLEAKAKFNLGNCSYRESERQRDSDMKKSLGACQESIAQYQAALKLKPDYKEAAENIEIVRLVVKTILDEIKKQEEAAKKKQKQQQNAAEKLKELIDRQQAAADISQAITEKRAKNGDTPEIQKQIAGAQTEQESIREETGKLKQSLTPPQPQAQPQQQKPVPPPQAPQKSAQVKQYLSSAEEEQQQAVSKLSEADTETAQGNQEKAVDELKKAQESLSGGQGQKKKQPQQQKQDKKDQKGCPQPSKQDEPKKEDQQQKPPQQSVTPQSDRAKDILDKEQENKKQRQLPMGGGYSPVDKDW